MTYFLSILLGGFPVLAVEACQVVLPLPVAQPMKFPNGREPPRPEATLPVGKWTVKFANGVVEECEIRKDGTASVVEPLRRANGKAAVQGNVYMILFEDDRTERWTAVGDRFVVEHWCPGSQLPAVVPVLGIAERVQ